MLYVVNIKDFSNDFTLGSCLLSFNIDTFDANVSQSLRFVLFNDKDNSLKYVSPNVLVKHTFTAEPIAGVTLQKESENGIVGILKIEIVRPSCHKLIKLVSEYNYIKNTGRFNKDFLSIHSLPENCKVLIVGTDGRFINVNLVNYDYIISTSRSFLGSNDKFYLKDTTLYCHIREDTGVASIYESPKIKKYIPYKIMSVLDLYALAIVEPDLVRDCNIVSDTEFLVNTFTSKYIFNVSKGLRNYFLKQKLLGWKYFSL